MRLQFIKYKDDLLDWAPTIGLDLTYFFGYNPAFTKKHNAWRAKMGFPEVLQEETYVQVQLNFGKLFLGVYLRLRPRVLGPRP